MHRCRWICHKISKTKDLVVDDDLFAITIGHSLSPIRSGLIRKDPFPS